MRFALNPVRCFEQVKRSTADLKRACVTGVGPSLGSPAGLLWRAWCCYVGAPYCLSWASGDKVLWLQRDEAYLSMSRNLHEALFALSCLHSAHYRQHHAYGKGVDTNNSGWLGMEWAVTTSGITKKGIQEAVEQNMAWPANYGRRIRQLMLEARPIHVRYHREEGRIVQTFTIQGD
jgi:hypothetical protein